VVVVLYLVSKWWRGRVAPEAGPASPATASGHLDSGG
jgi:hypothetical protein